MAENLPGQMNLLSPYMSAIFPLITSVVFSSGMYASMMASISSSVWFYVTEKRQTVKYENRAEIHIDVKENGNAHKYRLLLSFLAELL